MQFSTIIISLVAAATTAFAQTAATASYDTTYDIASLSTLSVTCSDGQNGLYTKGYSTLGSLPKFPFVAAMSTIDGWNSPNCGKCYALTYLTRTINVIAVDRAVEGVVLSRAALDALTDGQATALGRVGVTWVEVASSVCGL